MYWLYASGYDPVLCYLVAKIVPALILSTCLLFCCDLLLSFCFLSTSLLSDTPRCLRLTFYFPCPCPRISRREVWCGVAVSVVGVMAVSVLCVFSQCVWLWVYVVFVLWVWVYVFWVVNMCVACLWGFVGSFHWETGFRNQNLDPGCAHCF